MTLINRVKIIPLIFLFSIFPISLMYSQTGDAKSLEIGNKWWYYSSDSPDYYQKVIGDTMIQNNPYAIILDTRMDSLYWFERADSSKIFIFNTIIMEEVVELDFSTPDTTGPTFWITNDTIFFWDNWRARQCRYDYDGIGEYTNCYIKGLGLAEWSYTGHSSNSYEELIAGIIEGEFYGDSTVLIIEQINSRNKNEFALYNNYPNPFNPSTTIRYQIPDRSLVTLKVCNILGREVAILINEEKTAGTYELTWNAENLPSGVYFYRIQAGEFIQTKKMILLK